MYFSHLAMDIWYIVILNQCLFETFKFNSVNKLKSESPMTARVTSNMAITVAVIICPILQPLNFVAISKKNDTYLRVFKHKSVKKKTYSQILK